MQKIIIGLAMLLAVVATSTVHAGSQENQCDTKVIGSAHAGSYHKFYFQNVGEPCITLGYGEVVALQIPDADSVTYDALFNASAYGDTCIITYSGGYLKTLEIRNNYDN